MSACGCHPGSVSLGVTDLTPSTPMTPATSATPSTAASSPTQGVPPQAPANDDEDDEPTWYDAPEYSEVRTGEVSPSTAAPQPSLRFGKLVFPLPEAPRQSHLNNGSDAPTAVAHSAPKRRLIAIFEDDLELLGSELNTAQGEIENLKLQMDLLDGIDRRRTEYLTHEVRAWKIEAHRLGDLVSALRNEAMAHEDVLARRRALVDRLLGDVHRLRRGPGGVRELRRENAELRSMLDRELGRTRRFRTEPYFGRQEGDEDWSDEWLRSQGLMTEREVRRQVGP
ncbi:hypothetical protein PMZ80_002895 [Knufia obscura]|uniref:Uncharacterized protein n=2 Tax=Knufia TaxID=430999 RepID=A0AAN8ESB9_9EURO|nr:hypothetical protein PMZ80_002895 [Knufia obscura]KAK5952516.1 hypothetical protein OHC33_006560 [Knufia fluminis]